MATIFISGIGTGIGKTVASAIVCRALDADYWKPVQAGVTDITDSDWIRSVVPSSCKIHPEAYRLALPVSPHIAARQQGIEVSIEKILQSVPPVTQNLVIEGAGGLLVPLNSEEFVIDLIRQLRCKIILVSRNYLGSINHSLMTANICRQQNIEVAGWIFNDQYLDYEDEIIRWTGIPRLASIPFSEKIDVDFITKQACAWQENLCAQLC